MKALPIHSPKVVAPPGATWSNALLIGNEVIMSGVTARAAPNQAVGSSPVLSIPVLNTYEQAIAIFEKIEAQLIAVGGNRRNIIKLTVYLTNIADKQALADARNSFFAASLNASDEPHLFPCSTLVGVNHLAFPELTIEIDVLARLDVTL